MTYDQEVFKQIEKKGVYGQEIKRKSLFNSIKDFPSPPFQRLTIDNSSGEGVDQNLFYSEGLATGILREGALTKTILLLRALSTTLLLMEVLTGQISKSYDTLHLIETHLVTPVSQSAIIDVDALSEGCCVSVRAKTGIRPHSIYTDGVSYTQIGVSRALIDVVTVSRSSRSGVSFHTGTLITSPSVLTVSVYITVISG